MGEFKTLKEKCEALRGKTDIRLPQNKYTMVAVDGRSFSKLIKNQYEKPFDDKFICMMNETAKYVCENVQGCKFAYVQSDEITFVLTDFENEEATAFFDNRLTKLLPIISSLATAKFNQLTTLNLFETESSINDIKKMISEMKLIQFDCKAWSLDSFNDVYAYILWRQLDCIRNSKQMAAQAYVSHDKLRNQNCDRQIEILYNLCGIDWNQYEDGKKYGRFIYKEDVELTGKNEEKTIRRKFKIHEAFPISEETGKKKFFDLEVIPNIDEFSDIYW